ncbi:MAG TPA: thiol reductant ABC exporter subunit CydC [Gaiellaceae bacterium]|nr:thiol reductant ABC exporter subunit CydC [Gaiellaceae bacterium]
MRTMRRLLALAELPRGRTALAIAFGGLALVFGIALMATAGYLISRAAEHPPVLALTTTVVLVRFFALARPLARYLERLTSHDVTLRALGTIRTSVYRRIEPLAPAELDAYRRGDLVARMVADVDALQGIYLRGIGPPLVALLVSGACVVAAALVLPAAAAVLALGLVAGGIVVPLLAAGLGGHVGRRQAAARAELTADLVELLRGAAELVAFGREEQAVRSVRDADARLVRLGRRDAFVAGVADALGVLVAGLTTVGVLAVAVSFHDAGALDSVLIAALALLALSSFEAVATLPTVARELAGTLASGERVLELVDRRPLVGDPSRPLPAPRRPVTIALEDVTARYPSEDEPAFEGLALRIDPGRSVALVGPSGAGKTTVTNLLLRYLDPVEGRVTIDGIDLRALRQEDVRGTFALAGQEAHVFDSTIRENLRLARPGASDDELHRALECARLDSWVRSLPEGLGTLVGEEGRRLSGGQRQRLVVARALLSDAPVLVLDEPTAHLDEPTAQALIADVLEAAGDRSVLLITHRVEGLDLVDDVVAIRGAA